MNITLIEKNKFAVYFVQDNDIIKNRKSTSLKMLEELPILIYTPLKGHISPIIELLSEYADFKNIQEISNLSLFHSLLQTGQYISIAMESLMIWMNIIRL